MTADRRPLDHRDPPLPGRVTVARVGAESRARLAAAVAAAAGSSVIDLNPRQRSAVTAADVAAAARALAAERHGARQVAKRRLELELRRALEDRDEATARRDEVLTRYRQLADGGAWCEALLADLPRLEGEVEQTDAEVAARHAELVDAQTRLRRVQEQQAAAAAAIEDADRQLAELEGAGLDETGVRRRLEHLNGELRAAQAEEQAASEAVEAAAQRREWLAADLARLESDLEQVAADADTPPADTEAVAAALAAYEDAALGAPVDPTAASYAAAWRSIEADVESARAAAPPGPSQAELAAAEAEVRFAEEALAQIDASRGGQLSDAQRAELDAAHEAVLQAEERSSRGFGRTGARRQLAEARETERRLLEDAGFESYIDVVLTGGRRGGGGIRLAAEQRHQSAARRLEELVDRARGSEDVVALEADRDRMLAEITELLGVDPGDALLRLLEQHPLVPHATVQSLSRAVHAAGAARAGVPLAAAARAWLEEQATRAGTRRDAGERIEATTATVEQARRELASLDEAIRVGREAATAAAAKVERVRGTVLSLEGELAVRTGEDARRLERIAAAEQLRAQVHAVEQALARAETETRAAVTAASEALRSAELHRDRSGTQQGEILARLRRLAAALPPDRRVDLDGEAPVAKLALALQTEAERLAEDVEEAERTVIEATRVADDASAAARDARNDDGAVTGQDELDALVQLVEDPQRGTVAVLDEPFPALERSTRAQALDALLGASTHRPVVVMTDDPEVLGWAIALPAEVGAVLSAAALLAALPSVAPTEPPSEEPAEHPLDHTAHALHVRSAGHRAGGDG